MLAKSATDRIATAGQVAEELARIASQLNTSPAKTRDQSERRVPGQPGRDEAQRTKPPTNVAEASVVKTVSPISPRSPSAAEPVDFVLASRHATGVSPKAASPPATQAFTELRDAIGKVTSVERAVAMLKSDLTSENGCPSATRLKPGELQSHRQQQRRLRARQMIGCLTMTLAVLLSTLSTWASPGGTNGPVRSLAAVEKPGLAGPSPRRSMPTLRGSQGASSRAVIAQAVDGVQPH
jgi:hypothetical protein